MEHTTSATTVRTPPTNRPTAHPTMGFGDFETICHKSALPLCSIVGPISPISGKTGIQANCYARSVELANTIIFEAATDFMHILALGMAVIMILHVRSKFTAVGKMGMLFSVGTIWELARLTMVVFYL